MLNRLNDKEIAQYAPWAYGLAMMPAHASYPTYMDGIKTREDFIQRARRGLEDEEVLLFRHDGQVCGWIQWYALQEDNYACTVSFLVQSHAEEAAAEFAAHVARQYPGATMDIGVDGANAALSKALEKAGFRCIERAVNHTLFFAQYTPQAAEHASLMQQGEEADIIRLHTEKSMYWTAARILADLPRWRVYLYREVGRATGALVCRMDGWPEVFAVFMEGGFSAPAYRSLMTACLNDLHAAQCHHMTYFEEDEDALPILGALGFTRVGRYLAYRKVLEE